jgi:hypothetical protein
VAPATRARRMSALVSPAEPPGTVSRGIAARAGALEGSLDQVTVPRWPATVRIDEQLPTPSVVLRPRAREDGRVDGIRNARPLQGAKCAVVDRDRLRLIARGRVSLDHERVYAQAPMQDRRNQEGRPCPDHQDLRVHGFATIRAAAPSEALTIGHTSAVIMAPQDSSGTAEWYLRATRFSAAISSRALDEEIQRATACAVTRWFAWLRGGALWMVG